VMMRRRKRRRRRRRRKRRKRTRKRRRRSTQDADSRIGRGGNYTVVVSVVVETMVLM
jgi:hypothetical protein